MPVRVFLIRVSGIFHCKYMSLLVSASGGCVLASSSLLGPDSPWGQRATTIKPRPSLPAQLHFSWCLYVLSTSSLVVFKHLGIGRKPLCIWLCQITCQYVLILTQHFLFFKKGNFMGGRVGFQGEKPECDGKTQNQSWLRWLLPVLVVAH